MDEALVRSWEASGGVNPQSDSPLYNGRIPAEVRMLIFGHALAEDPRDLAVRYGRDFRIRDNHDFDPDSDIDDDSDPAPTATNPLGLKAFLGRVQCDRPEDTAAWVPTPPLLRLCRRAYMELASSPKHREAWTEMLYESGHGVLPPDEARPRRARFYTQMYWLESSLYPELGRLGQNLLSNLRDLRLTFRHDDWWNMKYNSPLFVDAFARPYRYGRGIYNTLLANPSTQSRGPAFLPADTEGHFSRASRFDYDSSEMAGAPLLFRSRSWALAFTRLPALERLTIDFETTTHRRDEMQALVDWAVRDWVFPMSAPWHVRANQGRAAKPPGFWVDADEVFLSAEGSPVLKSSWRGSGPQYGLYYSCPAKDHPQHLGPVNETGCAECRRRRRRRERDIGPRMLVWTVLWTPRRALPDGTGLVFRDTETDHEPIPEGSVPRFPGELLGWPFNGERLDDDDGRFGRWGFRAPRTAAEIAGMADPGMSQVMGQEIFGPLFADES
ncbi:hypothetical protein MAPG_09288 [Magnaporthiopsis poae ATCC 64411]|uniref:Uncharacterized protein n=1 Tax=Magnaporthiopsis poae (strain ATCC 64411 / 73-15) TaxID=644358 RepID=A0A0C4E9J6_MAGP6|nr:hypothetical protein MAPG_09288 [Magnaporthiopsis poae ATCC 64411]